MGGTRDVMRARILACYGVNSVGNDIVKSEEDDLEKGGEGSKGGKVIGHTKSGKPVYAKKNADHEDYKDFSHKDHDDAEKLHHGVEWGPKHMQSKGVDHGKISSSHHVAKNNVKKSEENDQDIEKGRKAAIFGSHSKDGKYIKTTQGWKRVEVHQANGGKIDEKPVGSAAFGSFDKMNTEELNKFLNLATSAKNKNMTGATLTNDEQYALDHSADIESAIKKLG